ncbi:FUSC family protein [Streptomyces sp. NPDC020917]|uniref:FUSC family protein n=1 Tax=Streptomyces sp. NPDC020917 TaxID=3365102 RepID=UPI0037A79EE0
MRTQMIVSLRLLDPGGVRWRVAIRTVLAAVAALLVTDAVVRSAHLPGGMVVIATVLAVLVSRSLHATSLPHRLSALAFVPGIGIVAAFTGRFMLGHAVLGSVVFVSAVATSRYLMRFGGTVRRLGRLALTPLIAVLVVPIPPSAAHATGPLWGGAAGAIAVACVITAMAVLPARPTREAAAAALDLLPAAARLRDLPAGDPARARAERTLHRAALTAEDRLAAARLPEGADHAPLDALSAAVLRAEVLAAAEPDAEAGTDTGPGRWNAAVADVRTRAAAVRRTPSREHPAPDAPAPRRRAGGWRDPQPQTRLTAQLACAMAAAFAAGHLAFSHRWTWTVITAFVVCSAARSRGDVVHRSGLRIAGAFTGAVTGTLAAHLVAGRAPLAVTVILVYLLAGLWLRDLTYAAWAFCVTSMLAVLHGMDGERGTALLVQRPEGILLGSACGIAAAYFVLPLRTETVLRGRAARALQVLQDLLGATRATEPQPAEMRRLARAFDRATRDLAQAAAPARAHRSVVHRLRRRLPDPLARVLDAASARIRRPTGAKPGPAAAHAHAADWADALAACAPAVRALAAGDPRELAAARPHLGLAALNTGQVRRRLGHRPDAGPPRRTRGGPPHLVLLNAALADLYDRLPTAPAPPVPAPAPAAG